MQEYKITLEQLNQILKVLGEFPANKVFDVIMMIHNLVVNQTTKE
jgi:hypothetical protein